MKAKVNGNNSEHWRFKNGWKSGDENITEKKCEDCLDLDCFSPENQAFCLGWDYATKKDAVCSKFIGKLP